MPGALHAFVPRAALVHIAHSTPDQLLTVLM